MHEDDTNCPTCYRRGQEDGYQDGWQDGFNACQTRYMDILKRFPLQCAAISIRLPLHPVQPDQFLEPRDWLMAQGKNPDKEGNTQ